VQGIILYSWFLNISTYHMDGVNSVNNLHVFRWCLLGVACDMFMYNPKYTSCSFSPNQAMKRVNIYELLLPDIAYDPSNIYVLHCSTPQENWVHNSDPFTHSRERNFIIFQTTRNKI
jgi:hypothetical protein